MRKICHSETQYLEHRQRLLSFINSRMRNNDVAEDILQDIFLKFEKCCRKDCECDSPKSYLFKMALNAIADYYKNQKKERTAQEMLSIEQELYGDPAAFPCDVYQCTYQFLSTLSQENQQAFIRSDIENIPQKQIAEEIGIPVSTLKSRVQRTRNYLKNKFEECLNNF